MSKPPKDVQSRSSKGGAARQIQMPYPLGCDPCGDLDLVLLEGLWSDLTVEAQQGLVQQLDQCRRDQKKDAYLSFADSLVSASGRKAVRVKAAEAAQGGKVAAPAKKGRKVAQLSLLAPFPRELTRCSPFVPVTGTTKQYYTDYITLADNSWGTVRYKGPLLTVSHEDLLLVTLAAVADRNKRLETQLEGKTTFTYTGSLRELLVARGNKNPNKRDYDAAIAMFEDMTASCISFRSKTSPERGFSSLIIGGKHDAEGHFSVTVNPYFVEMCASRNVTWSDIQTRMEIRSPYGKAIYRFLNSHQSERWIGGLVVLAQVINMPSDVGLSVLRERIVPALAELVKLGVLGKGSCVAGRQVVLEKGKKLLKKQQLPISIGLSGQK